ncbi:MAG: adenylate cyclase [Cyanobacteria bacterium RYN_339]|nr:adenylate cyclase [Cyanobacteria bacterium RYN_339]
MPDGEFLDVTVLFADIEGFTRLSERLPPREVVKLLNEYFTVMTGVVQHFGGTLDKYIGDAMMVVWEGDTARSAAGAAQAALAMQAELAILQQKWLAEGKLPLKTRIGISSGQVIVGLIGSPVRRDRTVIGDAVNTASRLEGLNKEFHTDIIMSQSTYELVADLVEVKPLGRVAIKGRTEAVGAYALTGWRQDAARP